ncbi:PIG-L family deacetylase [Brachybacterium sp. EF45031]|uniref:sugar-binding protein n=1 Tax=Brachybacterium sillae TaxID=2810536 RepID=UPI00217E1315|nr:sugar-binding protein [Brachybacterium sillae]MCS6711968.1 PIG-L family deacetylase [Brachybacterium sillae]
MTATDLRPSRRHLLQGGAALGLGAGISALPAVGLTPAERALAVDPVDLDILFIGAHPDDEAWTLAAFGQWNEYQGQRAGVITVTRGEGGGNAVGLEEGPALGLIREEEEREAVGWAGVEHVFNLDAVDFFYTLSAPLTRQVWGEREVLGRIVRIIRATRPDVIVTMNPSAVEGNHGNHQQAAMYAVEAYLTAGRRDVFPEHVDEGLEPWTVKRLLRSGSNGKAPTGPDAVATGYTPQVASDVVFGAWNGTYSERHGKRWSAVRDLSVHAYETQGWATFPPTTGDPAKIPAAWFTLIDSRTPLVDPRGGDEAALRGATLPIDGGLPLGTTLAITSDRFTAVPGGTVQVEVQVGGAGRALPRTRVALEAPEGWTVSRAVDLGTVPARQIRTARFEVQVPRGIAPGVHLRLRTQVTSSAGSGWNVLPLRTAGLVEAGLEDRPEIAAFLEWTERLGMQRLDALVPTRRVLGLGRSESVDVLVRNLTDQPQNAVVTLQLPEGITAEPAQFPVQGLRAGEERRVPVRLTSVDESMPTANRAPNGGVYPVTVTATASGVAAPTPQGLHLVPRLVASPTQGATIDAERAADEYPGQALDISTLWEGEPVTAADASGQVHVTYDDETLYVFVHVVDDVLGTVLPVEDNKQRFRTDSVEIMIDPRGTSQNTASTFILGVLPATAADGGGLGPAVGGRDHDQHQGPLEETAPGVRMHAHVNDGGGYDLEVAIPFADLPDTVDPTHIGFNVVVYDSDTQNKVSQSRIGWSTFPGVQADPYRWGVLELPEREQAPSEPEEPIIPDTAARSVESPQSILQSARDGVGLGGFPALPDGSLQLDQVRRRGDAVTARVRTRVGGVLRVYLWDGEQIVGRLEDQRVRAGRRTVRVPLTTAPTGRLQLAVSLEAEGGNAAASAAL